MSALDRIEKAAIRDLLGKGWLTHDGLWFFHTCREFGIEKANALNRAAIKSLAPIEIERAKQVLGIDKATIDNYNEVMDFIAAALEITLPDSVFRKFHLSSPAKDVIHWEWEKGRCFAYKGMKQNGLIDQYRCGVIYRIECWLEALGVRYLMQTKIDACLMNEGGACGGNIQVFFPAKA